METISSKVKSGLDPFLRAKVPFEMSDGSKETALVTRVSSHQHHFHVRFPSPNQPIPTTLYAKRAADDQNSPTDGSLQVSIGDDVIITSSQIQDDMNWVYLAGTGLKITVANLDNNNTVVGNIIEEIIDGQKTCYRTNNIRYCRVRDEGQLNFTYQVTSVNGSINSGDSIMISVSNEAETIILDSITLEVQ